MLTSLKGFAYLFLWLNAIEFSQQETVGAGGTATSDDAPAQLPECPTQQRTLQLLIMLPHPNPIPLFNPSWTQGPEILPSLYLAEDQINNRSDILPCHRLKLMSVDGGCDIAATTAISIAAGLFDERATTRVVGIVGPGCSASTLQTAHALNQPDVEMVQLHDAGTPILEDRDKYTNSLGILGSTQSFVDLSVELMQTSRWQNVAILFESNRVFFRTSKEEFIASLSLNTNVSVLFISPVYITFYPLDGVRRSLARVVFLFTSPHHTMRIMCLAYHMGMVYPAYQWIIISHRLDDFVSEGASLSDKITFIYSQQTYTCSLEEILSVALNRSFLMNYQLTSVSSSKEKLANITYEEFLQLYEERANACNLTATYWAYNLYDAVWAWARVLDRIIDKNGDVFNNFDQYGNKTLANFIMSEFYAPDFEFEGVSGVISFNSSTGFFDRPSDLYQIINSTENHVAYNDGPNIVKLQPLETITDLVRTVGLADMRLIAVFATIQFIEFFVIIALHVLTVVYRNEPSVRASSTKLSHFAFAGTYVLLFGLMLFVFTEVREHPPEVVGAYCQTIWAWAYPIGFTLTIGTVTVRTWRLYRIFTHYLDPGKLISNPALISMILILLSIDIIVAVVWSAADPLTLISVQYLVREGTATVLVINRSCRSRYGLEGFVWWLLVLAIKFTLLLVMVTLSLLTRRIPNKKFTTSYLRIFAYVFSPVFTVGLALYYFFLILTYNPNIDYSILCTVLNVLIVIYIVCIFVPPLAPIFQNRFHNVCRKSRVSMYSRKRITSNQSN